VSGAARRPAGGLADLVEVAPGLHAAASRSPLPEWAAGGWTVTPADAEAIAIGAGILGTGGGGNPYLGKLQLVRYLEAGLEPVVADVSAVPDDAWGCAIGGMGAPTVGLEKLPRGTELADAVVALGAHAGRKMDFVVIGEIGGSNAMGPLSVGAQLGLPVLDCDAMGRAFPELQMDTFMIGGVSPSPFSLADAHRNVVVFHRVESPLWAERLARVLTVQMGGSAALAMPLVSGADVRRHAIPGTLSLARRLGQAVLDARRAHRDPAGAVLDVVAGRRLADAKVVDVERRTVGGFARGRMVLERLGSGGGHAARLEIAFQNEYLVAWEDGEPLVTVPDLICLVDLDRGDPVSTEVLRYGLRVAVLALPAPLELKTPAALAVVGPEAFGYQVPFRPLPGELLGSRAAEPAGKLSGKLPDS